MKNFTVYRHPIHGFETVKNGFSWPAFFFGIIWMLFKKLWKIAIIWMILYVVVVIIETAIQNSPDDMTKIAAYVLVVVGYLLLWLIPGFKGNQWREENLLNRGFRLLGSSCSGNRDAAVADVLRRERRIS